MGTTRRRRNGRDDGVARVQRHFQEAVAVHGRRPPGNEYKCSQVDLDYYRKSRGGGLFWLLPLSSAQPAAL